MTTLRRVAWRHPHWWALGLSGAAWAWLAAAAMRAGGHVHGGDLARAAAGWTAMVLAMMLPLIVPHLRFAAQRSLWRRRHRAVGGVLVGYVAVWLAAGALALVAWRAIGAVVPAAVASGSGAAWLLVSGAAVWHALPRRQQALAACHHERPLAPRGWQADRDCLRYGGEVGVRCVAACGGLMLACAATGHGLAPMLLATGIAVVERRSPAGGWRFAVWPRLAR